MSSIVTANRCCYRLRAVSIFRATRKSRVHLTDLSEK